MTKIRLLLKFVLPMVVFAMTAGLAEAATTNVTVEDFDFSPPNVTISVNDSVIWNWTGSFHTTTSAGLWDSGIHNPGASFTNKFMAAGSFPYLCSVHTFMVGSVAVAGANVAPGVMITNPAPGAVFAAPWTGMIQASATDSDGSVSSVEFFTNAVSLGIVSNQPYNLSVTNIPAGSYALTAVATDNSGATNISTAVNISVVDPVPIMISGAASLLGGQFRLTYTANTGLTYVVERSSSLGNFSGISTNMAASSSVNFTDTAAMDLQSYYRVGRLPNP
jgi:plastocyanin